MRRRICSVAGCTRNKRVYILLLTLCTIRAACAQVPDGGSGTASNYPDPQCTQPSLALIKPVWENSGGMLSPNNLHRMEFNRQAKAYSACMHAYIDSANADLLRIKNETDATLKKITDDANTKLSAIEGKVHDAILEANDFASKVQAEAKATSKPDR